MFSALFVQIVSRVRLIVGLFPHNTLYGSGSGIKAIAAGSLVPDNGKCSGILFFVVISPAQFRAL